MNIPMASTQSWNFSLAWLAKYPSGCLLSTVQGVQVPLYEGTAPSEMTHPNAKLYIHVCYFHMLLRTSREYRR